MSFATMVEDYLEWRHRLYGEDLIGKLTTPNDGDLDYGGDGDTFPDWADGFNAFAPDPRDDLMLSDSDPDLKQFVPVQITLPAVSYGIGSVWFEYDASDPVYGSVWPVGLGGDRGLREFRHGTIPGALSPCLDAPGLRPAMSTTSSTAAWNTRGR